MKRIITAIGNEELNKRLKESEEIVIESPDIQYQEGIFEALDKYKNIDLVVISDNIIGNLELEDLIRNIILLKNDIEIILITEKVESIFETKNIVKVINNKNSYVEEVLNYILLEINISSKKATNITNPIKTQDEENIIKSFKETKEAKKFEEKKEKIKNERSIEEKREKETKRKSEEQKDKNIITVIGSPGIRQDNFYINICKTCKD